jgi:hypothetical protein
MSITVFFWHSLTELGHDLMHYSGYSVTVRRTESLYLTDLFSEIPFVAILLLCLRCMSLPALSVLTQCSCVGLLW